MVRTSASHAENPGSIPGRGVVCFFRVISDFVVPRTPSSVILHVVQFPPPPRIIQPWSYGINSGSRADSSTRATLPSTRALHSSARPPEHTFEHTLVHSSMVEFAMNDSIQLACANIHSSPVLAFLSSRATSSEAKFSFPLAECG